MAGMVEGRSDRQGGRELRPVDGGHAPARAGRHRQARRAVLGASLALAACTFDQPAAPEPSVTARLAEARAAVQQSPGDPRQLLALAEATADAGRLFEAADAYVNAIDHGAPATAAHAGLSRTYLRLGYVSRAVDELRACMTADRGSPDCLFGLATLFEAEGSEPALREARSSLQQMLSIAPQHPHATEARAALERIIARVGPEKPGEGHPGMHGDVGVAGAGGHGADGHGADGHGAESGTAGGGEGAMPDDSVHRGLGGGAPGAEDAENGAAGGHDDIPGHEHVTKAGDPEVGELNAFGAALQRAFAAIRKQDPAAAEKAFREALELRPKDPTALAGLAQTLAIAGKVEEATKTAEAALAADPKDAQVRWTFGFVMVKARKNLDRAVAAWEALAKDDPEFARRVHVPELLIELKKTGVAK